MAQAVSRYPRTVESRVQSKVSRVVFMVDKVALAWGSPPSPPKYLDFTLSISFHQPSTRVHWSITDAIPRYVSNWEELCVKTLNFKKRRKKNLNFQGYTINTNRLLSINGSHCAVQCRLLFLMCYLMTMTVA